MPPQHYHYLHLNPRHGHALPPTVGPLLLADGQEQRPAGEEEAGGGGDDGECGWVWGELEAGAELKGAWPGDHHRWSTGPAASSSSFSSACSLDGSGNFRQARRAKAAAALMMRGASEAEPRARSTLIHGYVSTPPSFSSYSHSARAVLAHAQGTLLARQQAWLMVRERRLEAARAVRAQQELVVRSRDGFPFILGGELWIHSTN